MNAATLNISQFQTGTKFIDKFNNECIVIAQDNPKIGRKDIVYYQHINYKPVLSESEVWKHFDDDVYTSKIIALWDFEIKNTVKQII